MRSTWVNWGKWLLKYNIWNSLEYFALPSKTSPTLTSPMSKASCSNIIYVFSAHSCRTRNIDIGVNRPFRIVAHPSRQDPKPRGCHCSLLPGGGDDELFKKSMCAFHLCCIWLLIASTLAFTGHSHWNIECSPSFAGAQRLSVGKPRTQATHCRLPQGSPLVQETLLLPLRV